MRLVVNFALFYVGFLVQRQIQVKVVLLSYYFGSCMTLVGAQNRKSLSVLFKNSVTANVADLSTAANDLIFLYLIT